MKASKLKPWAGLIAGMAAAGLQHQLVSDSLHFDCRYGNHDLVVGLAAQTTLSNFVADAVNVVGFNPWVQFVDYLEGVAGTGSRESGIGNRQSRHPGGVSITDSQFPITERVETR